MQKLIPILFSLSLFSLSACTNQPDKLLTGPENVGQNIDTPDENPSAELPADSVETPSTPVNPTAPVESFPDDVQKYNKAWARPDAAILIDASQKTNLNWDKMGTDKRVVGVIHRASIGFRTDVLYTERRVIADRRKYLWGAYHLGTSDDPIQQAQYYLKVVGDVKNVLMVLDLEDTTQKGMMNIAGAKKFMAYIFQQTGRVPVVYANHYITKELTKAVAQDPYFKGSRLWYARYRTNIPDFPKALWNSYFLWQFSSYLNCKKDGQCLYNVPGTDRYIDVNVFYGTRQALADQWAL